MAMDDAVTGFFFVVLVLALASFSALFFQSPGLRKALWDLLSEALGGDDEDEDKETKEDEADTGDERARRDRRSGGKKKRR
mmetsp:Transcript_48040/g.89948  ORF Transcript_48040/g.89948 Transcript_48040/m.89948 type:complete len:81 (-) Transcript_48040:86-328(-)